MSIIIKIKTANDTLYAQVADVPITLGSEKSCSVVLKDRSVSAKHCELYLKKGRAVIKGLDKNNGVSINGKKITEQFVCLQDKVQLGNVALELFTSDMTPEEIHRHDRDYQEPVTKTSPPAQWWTFPADAIGFYEEFVFCFAGDHTACPQRPCL
ncbi:MAG: FHA domain-containing protein [Pseudomonadota bacterium]